MKIMQAPAHTPAQLDSKWQAMADNGMQRAAHLLKKDDDGKLHVDNVRWGFDENSADPKQWTPRFRDTVIDPGKVKKEFLHRRGTLRSQIHRRPRLRRHRIERAHRQQRREKDNRLVVPMEAWTPKGESYTAKKGMQPNFGVVFQLGSFGICVHRITRKEGRSINLYKLDLARSKSKSSPKTAIRN